MEILGALGCALLEFFLVESQGVLEVFLDLFFNFFLRFGAHGLLVDVADDGFVAKFAREDRLVGRSGVIDAFLLFDSRLSLNLRNALLVCLKHLGFCVLSDLIGLR